jgi:hemolysin III
MFGIVLELTPLRRLSYLRLILYLTMGWAAVVAIKQLAASIPANALALLVAGGVAYTAGIVFYLWKRLPYHHAIWHVFVLSGSVLQFFAVLLSIKSSGA